MEAWMADINTKALLMLPVAIEELHEAAGEPDIAKVRAVIASVESTLKELLADAHEQAIKGE
jgi:hypothetical protein